MRQPFWTTTDSGVPSRGGRSRRWWGPPSIRLTRIFAPPKTSWRRSSETPIKTCLKNLLVVLCPNTSRFAPDYFNGQTDDDEIKAAGKIFTWLSQQAELRNSAKDKALGVLMDAQKSLWRASEDIHPGACRVEILERLHVTPRIWDAASLFHPKGSDEAFAFVKDRVERILGRH